MPGGFPAETRVGKIPSTRTYGAWGHRNDLPNCRTGVGDMGQRQHWLIKTPQSRAPGRKLEPVLPSRLLSSRERGITSAPLPNAQLLPPTRGPTPLALAQP